MPATAIRKIAVTTGGGDAPGLNAVIRAIAMSSLKRGWECVGIRDGFNGLLEPAQGDKSLQASKGRLPPRVSRRIGGVVVTNHFNRRFPVLRDHVGDDDADRLIPKGGLQCIHANKGKCRIRYLAAQHRSQLADQRTRRHAKGREDHGIGGDCRDFRSRTGWHRRIALNRDRRHDESGLLQGFNTGRIVLNTDGVVVMDNGYAFHAGSKKKLRKFGGFCVIGSTRRKHPWARAAMHGARTRKRRVDGDFRDLSEWDAGLGNGG